MIDPTATRPGSAEGRAEGCVCDPQVPRLTLDGDAPRAVYAVEPNCPVHGLAVMRAWLDASQGSL